MNILCRFALANGLKEQILYAVRDMMLINAQNNASDGMEIKFNIQVTKIEKSESILRTKFLLNFGSFLVLLTR